MRGGDAELDEIVDLALFFPVHPGVRVEGAVGPVTIGDLAGIVGRQMAGIELGDRARTGLPIQDAATNFPRPRPQAA